MLLKNLLDGTFKKIPNIPLNIVDIRDVADLHIRAMENPNANGQRFIATADGQISLPEIAELIRSKRPEIAQKVSKETLPNLTLILAAIFNERAKEGLFLTKMNRNVSNNKAKNILNWKPIAAQEETILAGVDTIIEYKLLSKN